MSPSHITSSMVTNLLTLNFFELFELPARYDVDLRELRTRYTDLQQTVHPDRFASAGDVEKRLSMQQTSHINEAYQTLKDPVARAVYLLKLKGTDVHMDNETTSDMAFLMEQMALREALADIRGNEDPLGKLDRLAAEVRQSMSELSAEFSALYENDRLEDSREVIRKLQFLSKAGREIAELTNTLEDETL